METFEQGRRDAQDIAMSLCHCCCRRILSRRIPQHPGPNCVVVVVVAEPSLRSVRVDTSDKTARRRGRTSLNRLSTATAQRSPRLRLLLSDFLTPTATVTVTARHGGTQTAAALGGGTHRYRFTRCATVLWTRARLRITTSRLEMQTKYY